MGPLGRTLRWNPSVKLFDGTIRWDPKVCFLNISSFDFFYLFFSFAFPFNQNLNE